MGQLKWVFSLGEGDGSVIDVDQLSTTVGDFVTLWFIWGCALGPVEASALGGKRLPGR